MAAPLIFISYRRDDCAGHAGRLADRLERSFGRNAVFRDIEDIEAGADFSQALNRQVDRCNVLLALIGKSWLDLRNAQGRRRIDQPDDWVRHEIARALERGIRVIPVLFQSATMPGARDLPPDLAAMARRNAFEIRDVQFDRDVNALVDLLRPRWQRWTRRAWIAALAVAAFGALGWLGLAYYQGSSADRARTRLAQMNLPFTAEAFLEAAHQSDHRAVGYFLDAGMPAEATDERQVSALQLAAENGDLDMARLLIRHGAPAGSALNLALFHQHRALVELLLEHPLPQGDLDAALQRAALSSDLPMMARLAALGADPRADQDAALFDAARAPTPEALSWLLERGADPTRARRESGETPLHRALTASLSGEAADALAVQLDIVRKLVGAGAPLDARAPGQLSIDATPLLAAISAQREDAALFLLDQGARPDLPSTGARWPGYPPLLCAAERGLEQVVERLLSMGVDVHARGADGATALDRAISAHDEAVVARLLEAGADVNAPGKGEWTPLMFAAAYDDEPILRRLITAGAVVNTADREGNTPLILAARRIRFDRSGSIEALLDAGADRQARTHAGRSAADILRERERFDLAKRIEAG